MGWKGERHRHMLSAKGVKTDKNSLAFSEYRTQYRFLTPEQQKEIDLKLQGTYILLKPEEHGIMELYNLIKKKKGKDLAEVFFALISGNKPLESYNKRTLAKLSNFLINNEEFRLGGEIQEFAVNMNMRD